MTSHSPCPMATPNMKLENLIKAALNTTTLKRTGQSGGGCINQGEAYITDTGTVFVKSNSKPKAKLMFEGESEGLKALAGTGIVTVPQPITVLENPDGGACLLMEFIEMKGLRSLAHKLGDEIAKMHMQNVNLENRSNRISEKPQMEYVPQFGFHTTTCCGYIPQENEWNEDWVAFFAQNRLDYQFRLLKERKEIEKLLKCGPDYKLLFQNFLKIRESAPHYYMAICGEVMLLKLKGIQSYLILLLFMAIMNMNLLFLECLEVSQEVFMILTTKLYQKLLVLKDDKGFILISII